jgi:hypothetical protein
MSLDRRIVVACVAATRLEIARALFIWPFVVLLSLAPAPRFAVRNGPRGVDDHERRLYFGLLLTMILTSIGVRRFGDVRSRSWESLADVRRFRTARRASATIGLAAAFLGLAIHWKNEPGGEFLLPFWGASFALLILALPSYKRLRVDPSDWKSGDAS